MEINTIQILKKGVFSLLFTGVVIFFNNHTAHAQSYVSSSDHFVPLGWYVHTPSLSQPYTKTVDLSFSNTPLEDALEEIAEKGDVRLSYEKENLEQYRVTVTARNLTVIEAFKKILEGTELEVWASPHGQVVIKELRKNPNLKKAMVQETVTGRVTDAETGEAMPGVNIAVKGTLSGTSTGSDGGYELTVSSLTDTLIFSFIGYQRTEVPINGRSEVNVELQPQTVVGEELVVTALGIERKEESLAYSTSNVEGEELSQTRELNVSNALIGKVAGVNVTQPATGPGGSSRIVIRGAGSLNGNNQPLYVINGMPINNDIPDGGTSPGGQGFSVDLGNGIGGINPGDIASITVLKSGAAAALYGSRASNGVILITTKEGRAREGIGVEIGSSLTFKRVLVIPDWQYKYGQGYSEGRPQTQAEAISSGRLSFGDRMDGQPSIQFDGEMRPYSPQRNNVRNFFRTGTNFINSVALSGGTEAIRYRLSATNTSSNAIVPNSTFDENNVSLNVNASLGERLSFESFVQYNIAKGHNRPKVGYADKSPFWGLYMLANTVDIRDLAPGYDENGQEIPWNSVPQATNPYFVVNKYETNDEKNRIIGQINITYDILDNLFLQGKLSRDYTRFQFEGIEPTGNNFRPLGNYSSFKGIMSENNSMLTLNYETQFLEDFSFSGLVGGNRQRAVFDRTSIDGSEFNIPGFYSYTNLSSTSTNPTYHQSGTNSLFGSADIGYRDMIFLSVTGRQDWFSTLNPENNSIFYPSIGGSLVLSEAVELPDVISYLKLRGSWAQVGGSSVDPYIINQTYSMLEGGHNGRPAQDIASNLVPNPDLRPLTSTSYEVGFDAQFLDYRLGINVTYYNEKTTDDIVRSNIASSSGYTSALLNVGEVSNKGIELLITGDPVQGPFNWDVSYNVAYNESEVIQLAEGLNSISVGGGIGGGEIVHAVGRPYGTLWGYKKKRNEEGQIIFDANTGYAVRSDLQEIGRGVPPLMMGLSNTFNYKNFSLNILIDGKFGSMVYSNFYQYAYRFGKPKTTLPGRENGLTVSGVDRQGNPFTKTWTVPELDTYYDNDKHYTALFMFDNSFIKLRQIILTYNLPVEKLDFINIQSASISLVGRNLAILYKDPDQNYFDPESSYTVGNAQGLNAFGVPATRNIGLNLQINL